MGEMKPWQLIVIAAAVLVLGYSGWSFVSGDRIDQPDGIMCVDVFTGQLYDVKKGRAKGIALPVKHPETGERSLFPVEESENGNWQLIARYARGIDDDLRSASILPTSGLDVNPAGEPPIRHVILP